LYEKHCSRSSFSFADSEVQRRISIDGSTSHSELSGHSATLKQIQNVATNLIHGSLAKSSKESYRRVFAFYKEFMLLYFPLEMVFPASLEHLTLFIAYCFQKKLASEMQANTLHATLIVKTLKNRFWVEIDIDLLILMA
jgi:hypothetical protein